MEHYQKVAEMLNGGNYCDGILKEIKEYAKENDVVIVCGASDDLMEFEGAIYDEFGCYEGGTAFLNHDGLFEGCDINCKYSQREIGRCKTIEAVWCDKKNGYAWSYKTDIPHATFDIFDDGDKYCLGICFDKKELRAGMDDL